MQVFVPHDTLEDSVRVLDPLRLGKQRVETYQILLQLFELAPGERPVFKADGSPKLKPNGRPVTEWDGTFHPRKPSWRNHPAVLAWEDNPGGLLMYQQATCAEWTTRGNKDTCLKKSMALFSQAVGLGSFTDFSLPDWWGNDKIHASHRAALLWKAPIWYAQFDWQELPQYQYVWPVTISK